MNFKKFILKTLCYFNNIIKIEEYDFDILIDQKSLENILSYNISNKTLIGSKRLHIRFNKIDRFVRIF